MYFNALKLQNYALAYVCLWATAPILAYGTAFRVIAVLAVAIWAVLEVLRPSGVFQKPTLTVYCLLSFMTYIAIIEGLTERDFAALLQTFILLFFLLVFESRKAISGVGKRTSNQ